VAVAVVVVVVVVVTGMRIDDTDNPDAVMQTSQGTQGWGW